MGGLRLGGKLHASSVRLLPDPAPSPFSVKKSASPNLTALGAGNENLRAASEASGQARKFNPAQSAGGGLRKISRRRPNFGHF